jgi:hypothetical protein
MPIHITARRALSLAAFAAGILACPVFAQSGPGSATQIKPGESCPPGMTEVRPRNCRAPEQPAPSILGAGGHGSILH